MSTSSFKWLKQSGPASGKKGPAYRNVGFDQPPTFEDGTTTLYDLFTNAASKHADLPCLGSRPVSANKGAGEYVWEV